MAERNNNALENQADENSFAYYLRNRNALENQAEHHNFDRAPANRIFNRNQSIRLKCRKCEHEWLVPVRVSDMLDANNHCPMCPRNAE
jgi:hypothetical protein